MGFCIRFWFVLILDFPGKLAEQLKVHLFRHAVQCEFFEKACWLNKVLCGAQDFS